MMLLIIVIGLCLVVMLIFGLLTLFVCWEDISKNIEIKNDIRRKHNIKRGHYNTYKLKVQYKKYKKYINEYKILNNNNKDYLSYDEWFERDLAIRIFEATNKDKIEKEKKDKSYKEYVKYCKEQGEEPLEYFAWDTYYMHQDLLK